MASSTAEIYDLSAYTRAYDPTKVPQFTATNTPTESRKSNPPLNTTTSRGSLSTNDAPVPGLASASRQPLSPPCSEKSSHSSTPSISSEVAEQIFDLIEGIVERKMTEALRPYLLNTKALAGERADLHQQNDTFSRQIDLHYNSIQRQNDLLDSQAQTFAAVTGAQANAVEATNQGLITVSNLVNHMSQTVTTITPLINEAVSTIVQTEVREALREVLQAHKAESMSVCSTLNESKTGSSESTVVNFKNCPCDSKKATRKRNCLVRTMKKMFGKT